MPVLSRGSLGVVVLCLLAALGGGIAGGVVAVQLDDDSAAPATEESVAASPTLADDAAGGSQSVRAAIDHALPAVVTVIADGPERVDEDGNVSQLRSLGSGVVVSAEGFVITNYHVIEGAETITVRLETGEDRRATVVSDDAPFTDLAVLSIAEGGLRTIEFGDSGALLPGDTVVAVSGGAIVGSNSVSVWTVGGTGRTWARDGRLLEDLVQTDAAVNNGDSGAALVNLDGELVGLLTTVVRETPTGQSIQGIAFAQSSNTLRPVVENIITFGSHPRPRIGIERHRVGHIELTPELSAEQSIAVPFGAYVLDVPAGSPAAVAGIQPGDIIVGVEGVAVDLEHPFVNLLAQLTPGEPAELAVLRGSRQLAITVSPSKD